MSALKPCPFCGGEAGDATATYSKAHVDEQGWEQATFFYCNCTHCGADNKSIVGRRTVEAAREAWNRRTSDNTIADLVQALEDLLPFVPVGFATTSRAGASNERNEALTNSRNAALAALLKARGEQP